MSTQYHIQKLLPGQQEFMEAMEEEVLYSGAFGAGKTRIGCEKIYMLSLFYPNNRCAILRKTFNSLRMTTMKTFFDEVLLPQHQAKWLKDEWTLTLKNGSQIYFLGFDQKSQESTKIGSLQLGAAFVDECVEIAEQEWLMLGGRLRWKGVPFYQLFGATNPGPPTHWLYNRFYLNKTPDRRVIESNSNTNTFLPKSYLKRLNSYSGRYKERYVEGKWIGFEGLVYSCFDADRHVIDPIPITTAWEVWRAIDFGYTNPFVCFDDETEVLTPEGWKLFSDNPELVATVNQTTKELEFQQPTSRIVQRYKGDMIVSGKGNRVLPQFSVTPNHMMVTEEKRTGKWNLQQADSMSKWRAIPLGGWRETNKKDKPIKVGGYAINRSDFARFFGLWLADGCLGNSAVRVAQKNKVKEVEAILDYLSMPYNYWTDKNGVSDYNIQCKELHKLLLDWCGEAKSNKKRIPKYIFSWSPESLLALLEGFLVGDGAREGKLAVSTSEGLIDDLQTIAARLGIPTNKWSSKSENNYANKSIITYYLRLMKSNRVFVNNLKLSRQAYDGYVYCITVPNGTLVVRRRGTPIVAGNCQWWARPPKKSYSDAEKRPWYMIKELYHSEMLMEDAAKIIHRHSQGMNIRGTIGDWDAEDRKTLERHGIPVILAKKEIIPGIQHTFSELEQGNIYFFRNANIMQDEELVSKSKPTSTLMEFPNYIYNPKESPLKGLREVPLEKDNHGMDAMRYLHYTMNQLTAPTAQPTFGRKSSSWGSYEGFGSLLERERFSVMA